MEGYREVLLGKAAAGYIEDRLANGLGLARRVLAAHQIAAGRMRTLVPAESAESVVEKFEQGGLIRSPAAYEWYVDWVRKFLCSGADHLCVLENSMAQAGDSGLLDRRKSRLVLSGNEVYHVICAHEVTTENLKVAISEARSAWISLGFMTHAPPSWNLSSRMFSPADLAYMAKNVEGVVVDAYDGEGWLVWEKHNTLSVMG
jgi:hypothetical protein